ncbi:MAG: hypothetical protein HYZ53_18155 [Planctomycetes bacterium]|nr:hypothetical protein [Planctomycetota bacterium]
MKRFGFGCLLATAFLLGVAQGSAEAAFGLKAQVTGVDALTQPGVAAPVQVRVALTTIPFFQPHLHGTTVKLYKGSEYLGSATTGDEGIANFSYVPTTTGYTILTAKLSSSWLSSNAARIVVGSFPASTKFLVTDIDHTIAKTNDLSFLFSSNPADTATMPFSQDALAYAAAHGWKVIYLTARDHRSTVKTKDWLLLKHYPVGCSFFMDQNLTNLLSQGAYKKAKIAELKHFFPLISVGVGNMPGDADAYLSNGMTALILPKRDPFGDPTSPMPSGTHLIANWLFVEPYTP